MNKDGSIEKNDFELAIEVSGIQIVIDGEWSAKVNIQFAFLLISYNFLEHCQDPGLQARGCKLQGCE